jgi:hypothetical protein
LRGDVAAAIESLEKAASERRAYTVARARLDPMLAALRDERRFSALVAEKPGE